MARFYGWSDETIMEMNQDRFDMYWNGITVVEAQELLLLANVVAYPHKKQQSQREWHREMHKKAFPKTWSSAGKTVAVPVEEWAKRQGIVDGK